MRMDSAPAKPEIPVSLPSTPHTRESSVNAPPIAVSPRPISSQDIFPNFKRASAISVRDFEIITIPKLLVNALPLPNLLSKLTDTVSSAKAPPIAVSPRPISSQDRELKFDNAFERILQDSAKMINAKLVFTVTLLLLMNFIDVVKAIMDTLIAVSPFAISFQDRSFIFDKAVAMLAGGVPSAPPPAAAPVPAPAPPPQQPAAAVPVPRRQRG